MKDATEHHVRQGALRMRQIDPGTHHVPEDKKLGDSGIISVQSQGILLVY